jgi:hypothetical protein
MDIRSDSALHDSFRDVPQTVSVDLIVSFVYGEVKAVRSIDLDVQEPWAKEVVSDGVALSRTTEAVAHCT